MLPASDRGVRDRPDPCAQPPGRHDRGARVRLRRVSPRQGLSEPRVLFVHVDAQRDHPDADAARPQHRVPGRQHGDRREVFALNGLGALLLDSITNRDYPVVQAVDARAWRPRSSLINLAHRSAQRAPRSEDPAAMSATAPSSNVAPPRSRGSCRRRRARRYPSLTLGAGAVHRADPAGGHRSARCSAPTSPTPQDLTSHPRRRPSSHHLLGTDELGRDELTRLLYAGRTDLKVGVLAVIFPFCFGTAVGTVAGFYGGWLDCDRDADR